MADKFQPSQVTKNAIKAISSELTSLESSSIVSLYEIDVSEIKLNRNLGVADIVPDKIRFHNYESVNQRVITFRGEDYYPLPIIANSFELSSDGSVPRPTLTFAAMTGIDQENEKDEEEESPAYFYRTLKRAILELDNLIGGKVTRIRTFYKFLDASNNFPNMENFSGNAEYNPEFPREIYYVQRKISEDKNGIQLELSSVLDLENFKLPGRLVLANRCPWPYRGEGCCYEYKVAGSADAHGSTEHLPAYAPPVGNDANEHMTGLITGANGASLYDISASSNSGSLYDIQKSNGYTTGDVVYILKENVRYYYVAKTTVPSGVAPPPHTHYWAADRCSKTLKGCKMRWGVNGEAKKCNDGSSSCTSANRIASNTLLPFGGFPGTNSKTVIR